MDRATSRLLLAFALGFILMWFAPSFARAEAIIPESVFALNTEEPVWNRKICGSVCVITYNPGGRIYHFLNQVDNIKRDGIILKIDGTCYSACTIAADKARPNVCITRRAVLQFHNGVSWVRDAQYPDTVIRKVRMDISTAYSGDILEWVRGNGGFPGQTTEKAEMEKFLPMYFDQARRYFKVCN